MKGKPLKFRKTKQDEIYHWQDTAADLQSRLTECERERDERLIDFGQFVASELGHNFIKETVTLLLSVHRSKIVTSKDMPEFTKWLKANGDIQRNIDGSWYNELAYTVADSDEDIFTQFKQSLKSENNGNN